MSDAVLRERLLATVPPLDDADWLDVGRRARAITTRRRNRRLFAIAAVLAILTALVVNPALGIGERLLDFVEGDPAPESVKDAIRRSAPSSGQLVLGQRVVEFKETPPPDVPRARLAIRLDSSVGPVYLWVAPAGNGACTALEIVNLPDRRGGAGQCDSVPTAEQPLKNFSGGTARVGERLFNSIHGRVRSGIVGLEVDLSDGRVADFRLVDGFFLTELPTSALPSEFRGFDAQGRLVMRFQGTPPGETLQGPPTVEVEPYRRAISLRLRSGRDVWIEYAPLQGGGQCWRTVWDTGLLLLRSSSGSCSLVKERDLPYLMLHGGPVEKQLVLLHGPVGSDIARLDLEWSDGMSERLRLEKGFVLKQIDPGDARRPAKLVGRDESGRVVAEAEVK